MHRKEKHKARPPSQEIQDKVDNFHHHPSVVVLSDRTVKFSALRLLTGRDSMPYAPQDCPGQFHARSPAQRAKRRARNGRK